MMAVQDLVRAVGCCQRLVHASHPRLAQNVSAGREEETAQNSQCQQIIKTGEEKITDICSIKT
jgi:hypothetical protein